MSTTISPSHDAPSSPSGRSLVVRGPGEGEGVWFLDNFLVTKACAADGSPYAVVEAAMPPGSETPLHRHHDEDEAFYVLEGAITYVVEGYAPLHAGPGTYVKIPRGLAHGFRTTTAVRMLVLTDANRFLGMTREAGTAALRRELPPPPAGAPDVERLVRIAARHAIDILGPLPL